MRIFIFIFLVIVLTVILFVYVKAELFFRVEDKVDPFNLMAQRLSGRVKICYIPQNKHYTGTQQKKCYISTLFNECYILSSYL